MPLAHGALGYDAPQDGPDGVAVFPLGGGAKLHEERGEVLGKIVVPGHEDLLEVRGLGALFGGEELLEELLPLTHPSEDDLDVFPRHEPRERDEVPGQVHYLHGLSHVEDEDRAVAFHTPRLEDELSRLRNGHEVAGHVRVSHRHRTAPTDLLLEDGDDAAAAAQHVAEPDRHEDLAFGGLHGRVSHHHLGHPFRRPHDGRGVHRLVGGDVHEGLHTSGEREVHEVFRAEDVVQHRLLGILLHEGDVLVRRGVEHYLRLEVVEDPAHALSVPHVRHDHGEGGEGPGSELLLYLEEAVLPPPQEHHMPREEGQDLPDDLAADGPPCPGDEDSLVADVPRYFVQVELDGVAVQQILDLHVADAGDGDLAGDDLPDAGMIRAGISSSRAASRMERITSPLAEGIAMRISSTAIFFVTAARRSTLPNTGYPTKVVPIFPGSSSRNPTGRSPASGWRSISRAIMVPASPAPMISTRLSSPFRKDRSRSS